MIICSVLVIAGRYNLASWLRNYLPLLIFKFKSEFANAFETLLGLNRGVGIVAK